MKPNKARRVASLLLEKMTTIDYATLVALGGTTSFKERLVRARISVAVAGLEPLFEDYALTTFVWSQQTATPCRFSPQQQSQKKKNPKTRWSRVLFGSDKSDIDEPISVV